VRNLRLVGLLVDFYRREKFGIAAVTLVVFYRRLYAATLRGIEPLCKNVKSFTKPEIHDVSQRRQRRTEQGP